MPLNDLETEDEYIPTRAARRRWRRQESKRRLDAPFEDALSEPDSGASSPQTPRARTPTQSAPYTLQSDDQPTLSEPLLAAIGRVWDLEQTANSDDDPPPFCTLPDPSNLGQVAEYASLLLDVFSRVKPVDDSQLTTVQTRLIATALTSVLAITQQLRVLAVSANEPLEPLPAAHDDALSIYSGCVVCYSRLADMLLMPCRHLTLCEVCVESA